MVVEQFPGGATASRSSARTEGSRGRAEPLGGSRRRCGRCSRARPVHLRGSRTPWSVVCAQPRRQRLQGPRHAIAAPRSSRDGTVKIQSTSRSAPTCRRAFTIDGGKCILERIDLAERRRVDDGHRRRRHRELARDDLQREVARSTSRSRRRSSSRTELHRRRPRRLHRHVPLLQDATARRELKGTFTSPEAGVNAWRFPERARVAALGARARSRSPTRRPASTAAARSSTTRWRRSAQRGVPTQARVGRDVRRRRPAAAHRLPRDCRASGSPAAPSGRNRLEWPLGKWAREARRRRGHGDDAAGRDADDAADRSRTPIAHVDPLPPRGRARSTRTCRSATCRSPGRSPTRSIPTGSRSRSGWTATEKTYVEFEGRTAWAQRSQIPFHVTSLDWQESDRVLAGHHDRVRRADRRDRRSAARGEFDGVMLEAFSQAAHRGALRRRAHARLGRRSGATAVADLVIENSYVDINEERHRAGRRREIEADGRSRSAIRARTTARRSTRASDDEAAARAICGTPSSSTTIRSTG